VLCRGQPLRVLEGQHVYLVPPLGTGFSAEFRLLVGLMGARLLVNMPSSTDTMNERTPAWMLCTTCQMWTPTW
jgi:hypothetical protein